MKIDLHCHTKATKSGDGEGRNVSKDLFAEKVNNAGVKIIAITNHNHFDKQQYFDFKEAVRETCQIWPGVEIDVKGEKNFHMIVVSNPDNVEQFSKKVEELYLGKDIDTCALLMDEIYDSLNDCDVIYIPHFHKARGIEEADREKLKELVGDESKIFYESTNLRTCGIYTNYGINSLTGSDVKDWNAYDTLKFSELKLPVDSFHQFCLLAKRDKNVVETLINKKDSIILNAKPHKTITFPIKLYQDVNIVFGPKGTGKTEIIKSLYDDMTNKGLDCSIYIATKKEENIESILSTQSMRRNASDLHISSCKEEFKAIKDWKDVIPVDFKQYVTWYKTKSDNKNKQSMKITEAQSMLVDKNADYDIHKDNKKAISEVVSNLNSIELNRYLNDADAIALRQLISILENSIREKRLEDLLNEQSLLLSNATIELIKQYADKNTETVSKPSSAGYLDFATNRTNLYKAVKTILITMSTPEKTEKEELGVLEEKGKVYVTSRYRILCKESTASEFDSSIGIRKLNNIKIKLSEICDNIFSDSLAKIVDELKELLNDTSIESIEPFIGTKRYITDSEENEYQPSNGEESIILLQRTLRKPADAYFLDEPELGMGNSYIDATIRPMISDLARGRKYVVIATHNANIAVRTLPYMSIYRDHSEGQYKTYIGNPFNDILVNIEDENDIRSWTEESLHTLEGGPEAFYERKEIYESKKY